MKKYLFLLILFFSFPVFATDVDVTSNCYGSTGYSSMYSGDEVEYQTYSNYSFGTTYQKQLSSFETELRYNLSADTEYTITFNTNGGNDFRNNFRTWNVYDLDNSNNDLVTGFTFVSMKKIQITFKTTTATTRVKVQFGGSNVYDNITGDINWNIKNAILTIPENAPTGSTNQDIINNQTDNTNSIINNNNNNTSNIIDNANQNTQDIINNSNDNLNEDTYICKTSTNKLDFKWKSGYYYENNGSLLPANTYYYATDFIKVFGSTTLTFSGITGTNFHLLFYDKNFNLLSANSITSQTYNLPSNIYYIKFSLDSTNYNSFSLKTNKCIYIDKSVQTENTINQNTQDIINNQNSNTEQQIESEKVCKFYDKNNIVIDNKYLGYSGALYDNSTYGVTDYIIVNNSTISYISSGTGFVAYKCFYTFNKSLISCSSINNNQSGFIDIPSNSYFVRFSISKSYNFPQFEICRNGNQVLNDSVNDLNDTLNNSNVDSGVGSDFFDDFDDEDFGLSQIITIPLNTIQSLTSKSCVPLQVPIPFTNSNINLPCMTEIYQSKFPSIYNLWNIVSFGIVAYLISIDIFHIVKGFKDPESDKVEVLDL